MERIRRLETYPKIILLVTGLIATVFTVVYGLVLFGSGFWYGDAFLKRSYSDGGTVYAGTLGGEKLSVTVSDGNTALFRFGSSLYGPFSLETDPASLPESHVMKTFMTDITIRRGEQIWFRGAVLDLLDQRWLYDPDRDTMETIELPGRSFSAGTAGRASDLAEPSATAVTAILEGPPLVQRGSAFFWFPGMLVCILTVLSILFWEEWFRWDLKFRIRDAE
ncbi:MAG: hypothetical protein ILP12_05790 [Lachnospiraceae bacterium]|nr:hypothetical protein [Lachnospiraceae bacterium]